MMRRVRQIRNYFRIKRLMKEWKADLDYLRQREAKEYTNGKPSK